ncbi:MAG: hypothetical protein EA349_15535 [Halomonadaceae bacterium]|nr:MAG: hypothetical protein EA349_15535 [Halomonadaceae bacterium]
MSNAELPTQVDAYRIFEQDCQRQGQLPLTMFPRLGALLVSDEGEMHATLHFSFDSEKRRVLQGSVRSQVQVRCQRCLEAMSQQLDSDFLVAVVASDDLARELPAEFEPVIVSEQELDLLALLEDELIMALPDFPLHQEQECPATPVLEDINASANAELADAAQEKENPFSVLADIKGKLDK